MDNESKRALRERLRIHQSNLSYFRKQRALYGLDTPLSIHNQVVAQSRMIRYSEGRKGKKKCQEFCDDVSPLWERELGTKWS